MNIMDEYIEKLNMYLPIDFADEENNEYRQYLIETFKENCEKEKYQFALMAFHMMFMSFLYKEFWELKTFSYSTVEQLCNNNGKFKEIKQMFDASIIPEQTVIDQYLSLFSWHVNKKNTVKALVDTRDKCAHASGFIQYQKNDAERFFLDVLDHTKKISSANITNICNIFFERLNTVLQDSDQLNARTSGENSLSELRELKLSCRDIKYILESNIPEIVMIDASGIFKIFYYFGMIQLHSNYLNNAAEPDLAFNENYFVDQLYMFLETCEPEIKESLRIQIEDEIIFLDTHNCTLDYLKIKDMMCI